MLKLLHAGEPFVSGREIDLQQPLVETAHRLIHEGSGAGADFLGWLHLASQFPQNERRRIEEAGARIREQSDVLVVIGIGGSYLGTRAALQYLRHSFGELLPEGARPLTVLFAGHNMSATYLSELLEALEGREVSVNVISKSGTTTEPALAFRFLKGYLETRYGRAEAARRIYATTDKAKGALLSLALAEGYETFVIPDDVGGRYSVLTPVGLLPLAAAGVDIGRLLGGAAQAESDFAKPALADNPAYRYAAARTILREKGKQVEMFVSYEPGLHYVAEWWKQLYGESEGKDGKALLPASADFSTDLHSLGQFIQEGSRVLFETVLRVRRPRRSLTVPALSGDADGLNYLAGRELPSVNDTALEATTLAHTDGGVPQILLETDDMSEAALGYLFYFFEKACAVSGYLLGVNPFDQPGVEAYKTNMFAMLGKPGFEEAGKALAARVQRSGQ